MNPACKYMFKVNNRKTRTRCEICSKLTIKTPEWGTWMWYLTEISNNSKPGRLRGINEAYFQPILLSLYEANPRARILMVPCLVKSKYCVTFPVVFLLHIYFMVSIFFFIYPKSACSQYIRLCSSSVPALKWNADNYFWQL